MIKYKFRLTIFLISIFGLSLSAQQKSAALNTAEDTLQYTLGAFMGQWMVKNSFTISNPTLFYKAMDDVMQNRPLAVNDSTIIPRIAAYQLTTQSERNRQMEVQLFDELKGKTGVGVLPNGVHYIVVETGSGVRPAANDSVVINAIGIFPDGTVFEDTYKNNQAINNVPANLIPGLNEAIQLMPEGSKWRIFIPSALAYGATGLPNLIPPFTALVFDITLERVKVNRD